jgi:uncharacterized protein (TIGR03086 family)
MAEPDVFVLADHTLNKVIQQIADDQWDMTMPKNFMTRRSDHAPTLRDGDLLEDNPKAAFAAIVETACAAAAQFDELERIVHCSFGDYPARAYFWQINSFRALRAHDIAKVIGANSTLPDVLVQGVWDEVSPHAEEWRKYGVFPAAVPVPEDAPLQDRLLGLTGRDPS